MKYSRQRDLILKALRENVVHPTADFIYTVLKEKEPNLSLATVYRNLNLLANEGIIRKIEGLTIIPTIIIISFALNVIRCMMCLMILLPIWQKRFWLQPGWRQNPARLPLRDSAVIVKR